VNMTGATAGSDYTLVHHTSTHIINGQELNGYTVLTMLVPTTYDWDGGTLTGSSSLTVATINLTGGTVSNVLAGSGAVNMLSGTATLSGDNTYDGGTFIYGGTLVATHSNSFGTGTITTPASGGEGTLSLSNDTATTWANDFEIQSNKKYLNIDIGGGGGSGTTHTFGNFSGNLRYHLTVLGSEGYNLTVGTTINSGQQIDIRNKSDGLFTATSVANPATRPLNFYENGDITITGDITRTGASRSYSGLGKFGTGTLTIGGAIDVGFMRMNEGTLTSTGAMMLNILNDGNSLVDGSSIIQGNAGDDETLNLNGSFDFDVTVADEDEVNTWQVVDMATIWHVNYAVGFTVNGASSGGGAAGSRVWTFAGDTGNFKFNEANSPLSRRTL
jgi:autotransporter-associated beta strand protein